MAFAALQAERAGATGLASHRRPKARSVVFCFMDGGPSHVDTFDPKPMLTRHQGEKIGDRLNNLLTFLLRRAFVLRYTGLQRD